MTSGGDFISQALTFQLGVPAFLFAGLAAIAFGAFLILLGIYLKQRQAVVRLLLVSLAVSVIALIGLSFSTGVSTDPAEPPANTAGAGPGSDPGQRNEAGAASNGGGGPTGIPRGPAAPREPGVGSPSSGPRIGTPSRPPTVSTQPQPQPQPRPSTETRPDTPGPVEPVRPPRVAGLAILQHRQTSGYAFDGTVRFANSRSIARPLSRGDEISVRSQIRDVGPGTYRVTGVARGDGGRGIAFIIYLERIGS